MSKIKRRKYYRLAISYKMNSRYEYDYLDEAIERALGQEADGGGGGFGERDLAFYYYTEDDLIVAINKINRLPKNYKIRISDIRIYDENREDMGVWKGPIIKNPFY